MYAGLTSQEAGERLTRFGPNDPAPARNRSRLVALATLFVNPLVIILLFAGSASAFLGQYADAGIIVTMVLLGVGINFVQTYRSQQAADGLRDRVAPTATVCRDGKWGEMNRHDVVPGDLIRLSAGDMVPADSQLLESKDLYVQQAALTGESIPAEKDARAAAKSPSPDSPGHVYLGTSVVSGTALAEVLATGPRTMFGDIARRLTVRPEETEFERGIRGFGGLIMRAVFFLVLFIMVVSVALHRDAFQSLLFAVALAVGLTPEFLPMITSVTLARGAMKMAEQKVIVKQLAAIQNFGSIDVLCSDKTGTITTGSMKVDGGVDGFGAASEEVPRLAWLNASFETGIRSPLDAAILRDVSGSADGYVKLDEIPFDFERRRLSIVVARPDALRSLIVKGAPEGILPACVSCLQSAAIVPMTDAIRAQCKATYDALSAKGLRVLAVASREAGDQAAYSAADERDLTLAGYITFLDPPIEDAYEVLQSLKRDGVQMKILTGDGELVTRHICEKIGFKNETVVTGEDILNMTDTALDHVVENAHIFVRIAPAQKTQILLALKHRGHVVGFMGDGINDAPSLRAADVGISVSTAVDVARDAAQIILVEPGLKILHNGIIEGRRAFGNVNKYLLMGTSSNFGNMFSMAGASLFLPFLPMLPTQILLNNFLYDLAQVTIPSDNVDDEYIRTPQRWNIKLIRNFMVTIGPISSIFDFLTFYVMLRVFHSSEPAFHTGWFVESLATQTLVLFVIRTMKRPWKSRPSRPLTVTTLGIVAIGIALPVTPLAGVLGFVPLPPLYFAFLVAATSTYLALVEIAKARLFNRHLKVKG